MWWVGNNWQGSDRVMERKKDMNWRKQWVERMGTWWSHALFLVPLSNVPMYIKDMIKYDHLNLSGDKRKTGGVREGKQWRMTWVFFSSLSMFHWRSWHFYFYVLPLLPWSPIFLFILPILWVYGRFYMEWMSLGLLLNFSPQFRRFHITSKQPGIVGYIQHINLLH